MMIAQIKSNWILILILFLAGAFLVIGLIRDETSFIMRRAISICLECIGIG